MARTLYAVQMVPLMNAALSQNIETYAQSKYNLSATVFTSQSSAIQFIESQAKNMSVHGTTIPAGEKGDKFLDMPGIGVITTVSCSDDVWPYIEGTEHRTAHAGRAYTAGVNLFEVQKEEAVFLRTEVHPFKQIPLEQATPEFLARWNNFQMIDYTLRHTTPMNIKELNWDMVPTESLRMVYGRGGMVEAWYNGESSLTAKDARFDALMLETWNRDAGIQYMTAASGLFAAYRDSYARSIVSGVPDGDAQIKAAIVVADKLATIAEKTNDFAMADFFQGRGEDLILELNGRDETTLD